MEAKLRSLLPTVRWNHTQGVVDTALRLHSCHQLDIPQEKVRIAALLHDCAKDLPLAVLLKKARDFDIVLTSFDLLCPKVIHAPIGAGLAANEFKIKDKEVLRAICYHTTGAPGLSPLAKIIFVADSIEPQRKYPGVEELRRLAWVSLDGAVMACIEHTLCSLIRKGLIIHPRMVRAYNFYRTFSRQDRPQLS